MKYKMYTQIVFYININEYNTCFININEYQL